jgi:GNAT superfamily N-acetyltransferase
VQVRPARAEDAADLAQVHVLAWQGAYRGQLPDAHLENLSVERLTGFWRTTVEAQPDSGQMCLVLTQGERLTGFAQLGPSRDADASGRTGELEAINLRPESWGAGGGQLLMAASLSWLRVAGFDRATLWVLTTNERARRFYEAGGWTADEREKADQIGGARIVEVRYARELAPHGVMGPN